MKQLRAKFWLAILLCWIGITGVIQAQQWYHYAPPPSEFDWELFAPLSEYDFGSSESPASAEGFFFTASRMHMWASRPTRVPIGNGNNSRGLPLGANPEVVYIPNGVNYGYYDIPAPDVPDELTGASAGVQNLQAVSDGGSFGLQFNSVTDAVPESVTGWGNRIELGWVQGDTICEGASKTGWMVSILSGVDMNSTYRLGFDDKRVDQLGAAQGLDGIDAVPDGTPFIDGGTDLFDEVNPQPPVAGDLAIPYQEGLTTVHINFADPFDLLLGFTDANGDGIIDDNNGDGILSDADRRRLGVVFDDLEFTNRTEISGVELLAIRRKKKLHGNASAEMFLGARFLEVEDGMRVMARGSILADSYWNNTALNRIVGPEFGLRVVKRSRRWSTVMSGRFMAGANFLNIRQNGSLGDHGSTTGPNATVTHGIANSFGGADFINRYRDERFSPVGEFRLQSSFHVTRGVTLRAGWEGMIVGGVARGSNTIAYALPTLGIIDRSEEMFAHGVNIGFEVNR